MSLVTLEESICIVLGIDGFDGAGRVDVIDSI